MPTPPCTECGAPCLTAEALVCSGRCRQRRKRAGRATPWPEYLAVLKGRQPAPRAARPRLAEDLPTLVTRLATLTSTLEALTARLEALERPTPALTTGRALAALTARASSPPSSSTPPRLGRPLTEESPWSREHGRDVWHIDGGPCAPVTGSPYTMPYPPPHTRCRLCSDWAHAQRTDRPATDHAANAQT